MKAWWLGRPLKLRLACWYGLVCSCVLLALVPFVYVLVEHQLSLELDRQLKVDWDLVEAHLEEAPGGAVRWRSASPATPDSPGYAGTAFDVWGDAHLLLDHTPSDWRLALSSMEVHSPSLDTFYTEKLADGLWVRVFEQGCVIEGRRLNLRVFRDRSGVHGVLRQIALAFLLGAPLAALLSALGGYFMAGRMLQPIHVMAERAQEISSDSLGQRLPVVNPHDELGRLATVVNETLERLEEAFDRLKRFTSDASHELRTPLTALRSVGEVGLRGARDEASLRETIGSMLEEAQRLNELIDFLLMLARYDQEAVAVTSERVELADLLAQVAELSEVLASEKEQCLEVESEDGLCVESDRVVLRQVLLNLVHNAILHSPVETRVFLKAFVTKGAVVIDVIDEGPGIALEHQEKIFDRFFRVDKVRTRGDGGFGLGLSIVQLSLDRLGGRIDLYSELGHGSRFRVTLPVG